MVSLEGLECQQEAQTFSCGQRGDTEEPRRRATCAFGELLWSGGRRLGARVMGSREEGMREASGGGKCSLSS